ncbi:MAG: hypothetical protein HOD60_15425 [Candidatus Nitrosopelagicus sp.]|nr:hypothetical protein [Candidatus Nitrosopelagicus sp.]
MKLKNVGKLLIISSFALFVISFSLAEEFEYFIVSGALLIVTSLCLIVGLVMYLLGGHYERKEEVRLDEKHSDQVKQALQIKNRFSCNQCGTIVVGDVCPNCKTQYEKMDKDHKKKSYAGWYLLSILLGIIGGLVAWASIRNEDPTTARDCLLTGIAVSIIVPIIGMYFFGV